MQTDPKIEFIGRLKKKKKQFWYCRLTVIWCYVHVSYECQSGVISFTDQNTPHRGSSASDGRKHDIS